MAYIAEQGFSKKKDVFGNGQCATLVKMLTGAPAASLWREGAKITDMLEAGIRIQPGTTIATFTKGRYPNRPHGNHAALFVRFIGNGMEVYDQYSGQSPGLRVLRFGRPAAAGVNRAELYSIIA